MMRKIIIVICCCCFSSGYAQFYFNRVDSVTVKLNNTLLKYPFSGGANFIQASAMDLNYDGLKDLVLFDRTGDKICPFLNGGTPGMVDYSYAHKFIKNFPPIQNWMLGCDYNADGKEDIFCSTNAGIQVYKNDGNATDGLHFTLIKPLIYAYYIDNPIGNYLNLYVTSTDIPSVIDVDGDQDLDIVSFDFVGSRMQYFKNMSRENYGHSDSLNYFVLVDNCFGDFSENFSNNSVTLDVCLPSDHMAPEPYSQPKSSRHAGSCSMCEDLTGDGLKDLVIGDISFPNLTYLENGGTIDTANIVLQDNNFPSYDVPVHMPVFPCGFYVDVNNDSVRDLLVSPSSATCVNSASSIMLYHNQALDDSAHFSFQQPNFIQDQMIDVGEGAYPAFFDYNADNLMDIVVGNYGAMTGNCSYTGKLLLLKNIGTATDPAFEVVTRDYATISTLNVQNPIPTFGDLDADGDKDMLIGTSDGRLYYYQNTAGPGAVANLVLNTAYFNGIIAGQNAAPHFVDLDRDGDLDLINGRSNGRINYYENTGTPASPDFTSPVVANLGGINVTPVNYAVGFSYPAVFELDSAYHMLVGAIDGSLHLYTNIDGNLSGSFTHADSSVQHIYEGLRASPSLHDLDNNGQIDMVLGNYSGGLHFYFGDTLSAYLSLQEFEQTNTMKMYPNPAKNQVQIQLPDAFGFGQAAFFLYDLSGRQIMAHTMKNRSSFLINIENLQPGMYLCKVSHAGTTFSGKLVVEP